MEQQILFTAKRDTEGHLYLAHYDNVSIKLYMDKRFWQRIAKRWERGSEFLGGINEGLKVGVAKREVDRIVEIINEGLENWEEKK